MTGRFDEASAVLEEAMPGRTAPAAAARAKLVRILVGLRTGDAEAGDVRPWIRRSPRRDEVFATER